MKRITKRILCMLAAGLLAAGLSACGGSPRVSLHLSYSAERDALTGTAGKTEYTYLFAPVAYEPASVSAKPYAEWDGQALYPITGWDPETLLTEEYTGVGGLLYAADFDLPTLQGMAPDSVYVCTATNRQKAILEITDAETVRAAAELLESGEQVDLPTDGTTTFYLKFCSSAYPGIFYNVVYVQVGEELHADRVLYDRSTKRCVKVPYALFDGYLYGAEE